MQADIYLNRVLWIWNKNIFCFKRNTIDERINVMAKPRTKKPVSEETAPATMTKPVIGDEKSTDVNIAASNPPKRGGKKKAAVTGTPAKETKVSAVDKTVEEKADSPKEKAEPVITPAPEAKQKKTATRKPKAEKNTVEEKKTSTRAKSKAAPKTNAESTPKKKPGRKPAALSAEKLCDLLKKKVNKSVVASIDEKLAVDIVVWGVENEDDRRLYIEIKDKKADIQPYKYDDKDLMVYISYGDAMELLNGKLALRDAIISGKMTVQVVRNEGNILPALKLSSII